MTEEIRPIVMEKYELAERDMSALLTVFAFFELSKFQLKENFGIEKSSTSKILLIKTSMEEKVLETYVFKYGELYKVFLAFLIFGVFIVSKARNKIDDFSYRIALFK